MKQRKLRRFAAIGTALALSSIAMIPAFAAQLTGHLDVVSANQISGWAWNAESPEETVSVEITISGGNGPGANVISTVPALLPREDLKAALGSANHGFTYEIDWMKLPGETFTITASAVSGQEKAPLIGSFTVSKEAMLTAKTNLKDIPADKIALGPGYASGPIPSETPSGVKKAAAKSTAKSDSAAKSSEVSTVPSGVTSSKQTAEPGEYLGEFEASGYCNCQKCSGGYTKTYSGTIPQADHTISADLNVFPIGTKLVIDGITYTVEDKGSSVKGDRIDIYFASHAEALAFGLQTVDVYAPK